MDDSAKKQLGVSYWGIGASHTALLTLYNSDKMLPFERKN